MSGQTVTALIRKRLEASLPPEPMPTPDKLRLSERYRVFDELRTNRVVMGAFRYGRLNTPGKPRFDRVKCAIGRLEKYLADPTNGAEFLIDAANLLELEYVEGDCKLVSIDDGQHTPVKG